MRRLGRFEVDQDSLQKARALLEEADKFLSNEGSVDLVGLEQLLFRLSEAFVFKTWEFVQVFPPNSKWDLREVIGRLVTKYVELHPALPEGASDSTKDDWVRQYTEYFTIRYERRRS